MNAATYRIVFQDIAPDIRPETVKGRLTDAFQSNPGKIEQLLSNLPVTVKSRADYATAVKYRNIIQSAGGICRVEAVPSPPQATPAPRTRHRTLKTCPNCGYEARTRDDLLLTAHDGQGECPSCGIIVSRFSQARRPQPETPEPADDATAEATETPPTFREEIIQSIVAKPVSSLLVLAAVLVLGYAVFRDTPEDSSPPPAKTAAETVTAVQSRIAATQPPAPDSDAAAVILPGETQDFLLTTYLRLFHQDTFFPLSINPKCKVSDNKWENQGVRAAIRRASVATVSVPLWEQENRRDRLWTPVEGPNMRIFSHGDRSGRIVKGMNLLHCDRPAALAALSEDPAMADGASENGYRQSGYTLYLLEVELSVSVPDGPEFEARDLTALLDDGRTVPRAWREGGVLIDMPMVSFDMDSSAKALMGAGMGQGSGGWQATKAGILLDHRVWVRLVHTSGQKGLRATLNPDSGWTLAGY